MERDFFYDCRELVLCLRRLQATVFKKLDGIDILRNAHSHFLCCFHGKYNGLWAVNDVAAGKDTAAGGHTHGTVAYNDVTLLVGFDARGCADNAVCRT